MSTEAIVQTTNLTKRYGRRLVAVDRLNMHVQRGEVYGFLGPNGAGKTTTLKMLLGLIRPSDGTASVMGAVPGSPAGLSRVGALVESPAFYPYLSGRDNLRVLCRYAGVAESRIGQVLEEVELTDRAGDKFKAYSLGMKQRLGVAAALLKDPELVILDEPTNGLDPRGMSEMRDLIRALGHAGRTVLLSSHLLGEVEQICDRVGVIRSGVLIAEGSVSELRGQTSLLVRAEPLEAAARVCETLAEVKDVRVRDGVLELAVDAALAAQVNRALVAADVAVSELRPIRQSLEQVFLQLTDVEGESV